VEVTCDAHEGDKSLESLVAMSNHGRSGITRLLMGSVTDKVLHHIKNPMLIFREHRDGDPDTKLETIIVLLDGSPLAESVLPHVTALAKALDLKVTLVRAASTAEHFIAATGSHQIDGASGLQFHNFKTMSQAAGNQASEYITEQENLLRRQGIASIDHKIVPGSAANVIVDLTLDTPGNEVVMTTHGHSGPGRWTLGSVTDRVVRHSGDPVLVIRTGTPIFDLAWWEIR